MQKVILIIIGALAIGVIIGGGIYFYQQKISTSPSLQACTEEVKICSDGSRVMRVGPSCEFAECPSNNNDVISCKNDSDCPEEQYCQIKATTLRYCPDNESDCNAVIGICANKENSGKQQPVTLPNSNL